MSILQAIEKEHFIHQKDIIKFIASELDVTPKKIALITQQKTIANNDSSLPTIAKFEKLIVLVKENKGMETKYELTKTHLKELIAKNLNLEVKHVNCDYTCNPKPGGNGIPELNYITVANKNPQLNVNLKNTLSKMQKIREDSLSNISHNPRHEFY